MKKRRNISAILLTVSFCLSFTSYSVGASNRAPADDNTSAIDLGTPACQDFIGFATKGIVDPKYPKYSKPETGKPPGSGTLAPFKTDGIKVWVHNKPVYEWYDGVIQKDTPHIQWSASKDVSVALLARTIQDHYQYNGMTIELDTPLSLFFPNPEPSAEVSANPAKLAAFRNGYKKIRLRDLVEMSSGYVWKESYDSDLTTSSFMPMLYLSGKSDMPRFALSQEISADGPGAVWDYSGGNMNIVMAVLRKIHGDAYPDMPKKLLFDPLGMKGARFEVDQGGNFVGSSYVYMTLDDMGAFGRLLLQNGSWNGKQILPPDWTANALSIADSVLSPKTTLDTIKAGGMAGRRVAWLNRTLYADKQTGARVAGFVNEEHTQNASNYDVVYPQEMPQAPGDMFFAAGHYGQLIIVIPSQDTVIARTGYDASYWNHVQPLVVKALSCANPNFKPYPVADLTPPSAGLKPGLFASAKDVTGLAKDFSYLVKSGIGPAYIAKEMCSFLFVMDTKDRIKPADYFHTYLARSGLPAVSIPLVEWIYGAHVDLANSSVTVDRAHSLVNLKDDTSLSVPETSHRAHLSKDARNGCVLD